MVVFKQELRLLKRYIIAWTVSIAALALFMIPVYYSFLDYSGGIDTSVFAMLSGSDFIVSLGLNAEFMLSPMGMFSMLTAFFAIAGGIYGMHMGISANTREYTEKTAEHLFTKPFGRRQIFLAKLGAALCGAVITGLAFILASLGAMLLKQGTDFDLWVFLLIAKSFFLIVLFFVILGILAGVCLPNNRSPLLTAALTVFVTYCIASFARVVGNKTISYLSPFSFFGAADIARTGFYNIGYSLWYLFLLAAFSFAAYRIYLKKDILFV